MLVAIICFMYEGIIGEVDFLNNYILRDYVVSCGVCILLIMSVSSGTLHSLLRYKILTHLGKISYSLYLYHLISLFSVMHLFYGKLPTIFILTLSFFFSFLLSTLSYLFVEKPCISLGRYITRGDRKSDFEGKNGLFIRKSSVMKSTINLKKWWYQ